MDKCIFGEIAFKFKAKVYERSVFKIENMIIGIVKTNHTKKLMVVSASTENKYFISSEWEKVGQYYVLFTQLSHVNAVIIRMLLPFTAPVAFGTSGLSMGLGDRLGVASPGHIRLIENENVRPVLAQQSVRECVLTNRTFKDVLDAATWAVLQEGWQKGYGADGDHLKDEKDIEEVLSLGYSMLTLDCSEKINNEASDWTISELEQKISALPQNIRQSYRQKYLNNDFDIGGFKIIYTAEELYRIVLTYHEAIEFIKYIYKKYLVGAKKKIDFEISIDETLTPTSPQAHFFVANELKAASVKATSMAPRFCGEFQKAIDYIGDINQFEKEFRMHAAIADYFGYRLSIHSGSDKLSVYPIIGHYTKRRVHVKTAGTNWLEALRVICRRDATMFRSIAKFALSVFHEAAKYYHVTTDISKVPSIDSLQDDELGTLLTEPNSRQLLHITYGLILTAKDNGRFVFRDKIYKILDECEDEYAEVLRQHIGRHIQQLKKGL